MLETNGTLVAALRRVLPWLRYVSMDLKLPSVDGERVDPDVQRSFLRTALDADRSTWVKIVIGPDSDLDEFDGAVSMVFEEAMNAAHTRGETDPEAHALPLARRSSFSRSPPSARCSRRRPPSRCSSCRPVPSVTTRGYGWFPRRTRPSGSSDLRGLDRRGSTGAGSARAERSQAAARSRRSAKAAGAVTGSR